MFGGLCNQCCVKDEASIVKVDMPKEECDPAPEPENKQREEEDAQKQQKEEEGQPLQQEKEVKDTEDQKQPHEEGQAAPETQAATGTQAANETQAASETQKKDEDGAEPLKQEKEQEKEQEQAVAAPQPAPLPALLLDAPQQPAAEEKTNEETELRNQLDAWLKKNGFADVNAKKKSYMPPSHCYPLHTAVKQKDAQIVGLLVRFGADKNTPNSSKLKALDLANKNKKGNSHDEIIAALQ